MNEWMIHQNKEKVWSWKSSKLEKIEVGKDRRYKSSKLEMFEDYY